MNAVRPMLSFLKSASGDEVQQSEDHDRALLDEFTALDPILQSEAADQLAALWQCRNPAAFRREPRNKQDAYIAKFERVAARSQEVKHTARGHLHYSVALMMRFLLIARDGARQQSALDLSGRVAGLINNARDRRVMERRGQFVNALSNSLFDKSPPPITDVIVDRPMSFHDEPGSADADRASLGAHAASGN
jgi:hypothetical protein